MKKETIGDRIKIVRKHERCTQEEFGAKIGVKGNTITGYERGTRKPSDAVINNLCRTFLIDQTWLRTGDGQMEMVDPAVVDTFNQFYMEHSCNPLEQKFLDGYFSLSEPERDAFCSFIKKMFPAAVQAIAGDNALVRPWQEAPPLETPKDVDVLEALQKQPTKMPDDELDAGTPSGVSEAEADYEKNLGFVPNTGLSASNITGDMASPNEPQESPTDKSGGGESGDNVS